MDFELLLLRVLKTFIGLLGLILSYLSIKAYNKSKAKNMLFLGIGFGIITAGSLIAGLSFEYLGFTLRQVNIVESLMILVGFITILYSIYGTDWGSNFPYSSIVKSLTSFKIYGSFWAISNARS